MQAAAVVDQSPPLENDVQTSAEDALGARTQSGMQTAKNPRMLKKRIAPSKRGRYLAVKMLKQALKSAKAIVRRVPCLHYDVVSEQHRALEGADVYRGHTHQGLGTKVPLRLARIRTNCPLEYAVPAMFACQASADSQPEM